MPSEASSHWDPSTSQDDDKSSNTNDNSPVSEYLKCTDPATGWHLGWVKKHAPAEIEPMLERARIAQSEFHQSPQFHSKRMQFLRDLSEFIISHQQDIANVCSRDTGKTFTDAFFGELLTTLEKVRWLFNYGAKALRPQYRSVGPMTLLKSARVEYHPRGVVAAIVSWNYGFHNVFGPMVASVFAGNAIVIKSSEVVAWSTVKYFGPLIKELLLKNEIPTDLVQFLIGEGDVGDALVRSSVDKVTFIGSPAVGKMVMRAASDRLTPVTLELGGKDAAIICDDADLDQAIPIIMRGTFQNVGQNCVGLERIVVHSSVYENFLSIVTPQVQNLRVAAPLCTQDGDCGAITLKKQLAHIERLINDAVSKGARLLAGGGILSDDISNVKGQFFAPTLIADITSQMLIAQEEVFGPVMAVMKFDSDQDAIALVNSAAFGLGGSVFSSNIQRAESITARIRTGMANINDFAVNYLCQSLPFGGCKQSGFGRFAGVEGLRDECIVKAVTKDKVSWIKNKMPSILQYPIEKKKNAEFCKALATVVYAESWVDKFRSLGGLINS